MNDPIIVIGAGPAGASAALGLIRSGKKVKIFEQHQKWTGRVCGTFLSPDTVRSLQWLGVWENRLVNEAIPIKKLTVTYQTKIINQVRLDEKGNSAFTLPRKVLEDELINKIKSVGGDISIGQHVTEIKKERDEWTVTINHKERQITPYVILAHGRFPINYLHTTKEGWYGWNIQFKDVLQNDGDLSFHMYRGGYIGVQTYRNGQTNVCGAYFRRAHTLLHWEDIFHDAMEKNPHFKLALKGAERNSNFQGVGPLQFSNHMLKKNGAVMVGDAAAVGDPYMGEGIGRGLQAGPMIFKAINNSSRDWPQEYDKLWDASYKNKLLRGGWIRSIINWPAWSTWPVRMLFKLNFVLNKNIKLFHKGGSPIEARIHH